MTEQRVLDAAGQQQSLSSLRVTMADRPCLTPTLAGAGCAPLDSSWQRGWGRSCPSEAPVSLSEPTGGVYPASGGDSDLKSLP